jgi:thiol-disulfide isomerase/thioredoxin
MRPRHGLAALAVALVAALSYGQQVPRHAGEFAISLNNGGQLLLSQYSGKIVVLMFMFTTCPHCQRTTQVLNGIAAEYAPRGVQILAAAYNPDAEQLVPGFIAQFRPAFPVGYASRDQVLEYLQHPPGKPLYVPELIFIDRHRMIRGQFTGSDDFFKDQDKSIRATLDALLKEPVAAKKSGSSAHKKRS